VIVFVAFMLLLMCLSGCPALVAYSVIVLRLCRMSAHQGRVTGVQLVEKHSWLLSCSSADKCFTCFSTETGLRLSGYLLSAPCTCLLYPSGWPAVMGSALSGSPHFCVLVTALLLLFYYR